MSINIFMMREALLLGLLFISTQKIFSQGWTQAKLDQANTAKNIDSITPLEKEIILYINLCRRYPQDFLNIELLRYSLPKEHVNYLPKSAYRKSLIEELRKMKSVPTLSFSGMMQQEAKCFSSELYRLNKQGHERIGCGATYNGECISYGMYTAKDIVMQLLIDHNIASLGHRKICLMKELKTIGASFSPHKSLRHCTVLDFSL